MLSNSNSSDAASGGGPLQPESVLRALLQSAVGAINAQWEAYATRLADALFAYSERGRDSKQANASFHAAHLLRKNSYPFAYLASEHLQRLLQSATQAFVAPRANSDTDHGGAQFGPAATLALVSYADIEREVLLGNVARPLDSAYAEPLNALGLRLAALFGRDELTLADNPFRPQLLVQALDAAWREFNAETEPDAQQLPLQLLQVDTFIDLTPVLAGLNRILIESGVLPQLEHAYRIRKANAAAAAQRSAATVTDAQLLQQLQRLFAIPASTDAAGAAIPGSGSASVAGSTPTARGADAALNQPLFDYLASLQRAMLERQLASASEVANGGGAAPAPLLQHIRQQTPAGTLSRSDENTLDLLARIFDVIFDDPSLPAEIRQLVGFLQVPVLKAALIDQDFFFNGAHPARRLIDVLTTSGAGWNEATGTADPVFQALQRNVMRVQRDFDQQVSVFADVVSELETVVRDQDAVAASRLAAPIDHALREERLQQAGKQAKSQVALRVGSGEVVAFIEAFLESKWVPVLTIAYSRAERQPRIVDSALKTMDDLIWSVQPKITPEQRRQLLARLPSMLAALNRWLDLIDWDDAERLRFFAELAECHASIVRAPLNLSPQRQLELALEATQRAAERRLEKQAAALAAPPPAPPDPFVTMLAQMETGAWLRFEAGAGTSAPRRMKLAWISPLRTLYIFTTRERKESFSISDTALAQALREQRAAVLPADSVVERALVQALHSMGANDPQHATAASA